MVACSENPASPKSRGISPKLNINKGFKVQIKEGNEYSLVVNSELERYNKHGAPIKKYKHQTDVSATVIGGILKTTKRHGTLTNVSLSRSTLIDEVPDSVDMMPVLGIATGEYDSNYDETQLDDSGHVSRIVGTSTTQGYPVDRVTVYSNDAIVVKVYMQWEPISGGFAMTSQIQKTFTSDGTLVAIVSSTPDYSTLEQQYERSLPYQVAKSIQYGAYKVLCALGPSVAYASTTSIVRPAAPWLFGCGGKIALFAGETFVLGVATAVEITNPWLSAAYVVGWGLWTHALHDMLHCLKHQ